MKFYSKKNESVKYIYKDYIKHSIKNSGTFIKFSYAVEKILLCLAAILSVLNVIYVFFYTQEPLFLLFLLISGGFPFGISLIFKSVYREWILKDYKYRINEKLGIDNNILQYSYTIPITNVDKIYIIDLKSINRLECDSVMHMVTVIGKVEENSVIQNEFIEKKIIDEVSFFDVFDNEFTETLKNMNIEIKEI